MIIKFLNVNAWNGGKLFDPLFDFIKEQNADVVTLQEAYAGKDPGLEKRFQTVKILTSDLDYPYHYFSPTFLDNLGSFKIDKGNLILSKYPITFSKTSFVSSLYGEFSDFNPLHYPIMPRNLQQTTIKLNNLKINVFNIQGIWDMSGKDNPDKLKMSEIIINEIQNTPNVILAGDFNISPNTQTIDNIEKHLINIFKNDLSTSFNMKRKTNPGYATAVVDMVFTSHNIKTLSKSCLQVDISDHLPLICQFNIE